MHISRPSLRLSSRLGLSSGVTLLEMLVVLGIIVILMAVATPQIRKGLQRARFNAAAQQIVQEIKRARSEAKRTSDHQELSWSWNDTKARYDLILSNDKRQTIAAISPEAHLKITPNEHMLIYEAPYGRIREEDRDSVIEIESERTGQKLAVIIMGVTGRVVVQR